jgi:four helix bundle protein
MNYTDWLKTVPAQITGDTLWRMEVYRQATFLGDLAWADVCKLAAERRMLALSDQLYRAVGGIGATIAEGYSRASDKEQARFYEYALGSAREARDWYYKGRPILGEEVTVHRMDLLVNIIRQLLVMVPAHRARTLREDLASYLDSSPSWESLTSNPPMP